MQKKNKAFTLIELILYLSLVSVLVIGVTSFFSIIKDTSIKEKSISTVEEEGAFSADILSQKIREARNVCIPTTSGTSGQTLMLDMDTNCNSHTANRVRFALDGSGILQITEGAGSPVNLTDDRVLLSSLIFVKAEDPLGGSPSINYTFIMQAKSYSGTSEYYYSKTFSGGGTLRE